MLNVNVKIEAPELVEVLKSILNVMVLDRQLKAGAQTAPETATQVQPQPHFIAPAASIEAPQPPYQQPAPAASIDAPQPPMPGPVPTAPQTYTLEQLSIAATALIDAGRRVELVALLGTFSVPALTALPQEQYGNFATHLRGMGAKI